METVEISAGPLLLRPFGPDDAGAVFAACQDPDIQRWTSVPAPYSMADAEAFTSDFCPAQWASGGGAVFAVTDRGSGELLGSVGLDGMLATPGAAELGYWVVPAARGRGVMSSAAAAVCRWGFTALDLDRIRWHAAVGNAASRRVAEKVGFVIQPEPEPGIRIGTRIVDAWVGTLLPGRPAPPPTRTS